MKTSLNWLRELVDLPSSVPELVDLLTLAGVEVEGVETRGCAIEKVVVAQIKESVQHPNADRLSVCKVDDGSGTTRQIVCGAKNYKVGDKVPLALPGAQLAPDFTIKVGKLRGVESQGMMCSAKELQLAEDAEGLLILPPDTAVGTPIGALYPGDTVLDLEVTPNRPDLLSHFGIAREIAALTGAPLRTPSLELHGYLRGIETVEISAAACPFYSARRIDGVKVGPSPEWLRHKLEALGLRPINNVVDVTNYVMLELGAPLHAFDASTLRGALRVRVAAEGEKFLALDGRTYQLADGDIAIADGERAVAIAGVMGGEETGVKAASTSIWIEAAEFEPAQIRRTSRRLGLVSDSSYRFERGIDSEIVLYASQRAVELILATAGGTAVEPMQIGYYGGEDEVPEFGSPVTVYFPGSVADAPDAGEKTSVVVVEEPGAFHSHWVEFRAERVRAVLGTDVSDERISEILRRLGLKESDDRWHIPSFRKDLVREIDLIEEVARVFGMDPIPARVRARFAGASCTDRRYDRAMALRRALIAQGLYEARSITLAPELPLGLALTQTCVESLVRVKNPMIDDQVVLRPHLLHGLLTAIRTNVRHGAKSIRLFEVGRVFSGATAAGSSKVSERTHLGLVLTGPTHERSWRGPEGSAFDLYHLKGVVSAALESGVTFEEEPNAELALSLVVKAGGKPVGFAGQLWPADARGLDVETPVLFAEIDLDALEEAEGPVMPDKYREIPRFPSVTRDMALLAPADLAHEKIAGTLREAQEPLLASVELFDVFTDAAGVKVPAGKRSLAYSLTYRSAERTLTADEVNVAHSRLKERLVSALPISFRE